MPARFVFRCRGSGRSRRRRRRDILSCLRDVRRKRRRSRVSVDREKSFRDGRRLSRHRHAGSDDAFVYNKARPVVFSAVSCTARSGYAEDPESMAWARASAHQRAPLACHVEFVSRAYIFQNARDRVRLVVSFADETRKLSHHIDHSRPASPIPEVEMRVYQLHRQSHRVCA